MKKLILTLGVFCFFAMTINAQELTIKKISDEKTAVVKLKKDIKADVYIDGKKYDSEILDLIDPDKIKSISILKGKEAKKEYNSEYVMLIVTKKKVESKEITIRIEKGKSESGSIVIKGNENNLKIGNPMIIIDGDTMSQADLKSISPEDIESISVIKDKEALEEYGAENGVILVTTKVASKKSKKQKK